VTACTRAKAPPARDRKTKLGRQQRRPTSPSTPAGMKALERVCGHMHSRDLLKEGVVVKQLADFTIAIGLIDACNRLAISFRDTPAAAKS